MNKKMKKMKKDIKRKLNSIEFKRSCKILKNNFLQEFKTAIYDGSYFNDNENTTNFHPAWGGYKQPLAEEIEDGNIVENSGCFLPLNISKATTKILWYKKFNKVLISCYNFQDMELNWITI